MKPRKPKHVIVLDYETFYDKDNCKWQKYKQVLMQVFRNLENFLWS